MTKRILSIAAVVVVLAMLSFKTVMDTYKLDSKSSRVHWVAKKTGGQHEGDVALQRGILKVTDNVPVGGEFILDMIGVTCTDISDPANNKDMVDHLKGEDFFAVDKHPTATIKIKTLVKVDGAVAPAPNFKATADLTIKGITKEISFPARIDVRDGRAMANADITIDRTKWNISYKSRSVLGSVADKFIYDDVNFTVSLVLTKVK